MFNVFISQFNPRPNQLIFNTLRIMELMQEAKRQGAQLILFGETALQGYNVKNSLISERFFQVTETCLDRIRQYAEHLKIGIALGAYRKNQAVYGKPTKNGVWTYFPENVEGLIPENSYQEKQLIPRQSELDEILYVAAGSADTMYIHKISNKRVAYHICQDSWRHTPSEIYQANPLQQAIDLQADVLINFSASPWFEGKWHLILQDMLVLSEKYKMTIIYVPIAGFEDQQFQFTAGGFVVDCGKVKHLLPPFIESDCMIDLETIGDAPHVAIDVTKRFKTEYKQEIKISNIYHALMTAIDSVASQNGIKKISSPTSEAIFAKEITSFLPEATEVLTRLSQYKKANAKEGFALDFVDEFNTFLLIHLLRQFTSNKIKIVLCLYEMSSLTDKQRNFLGRNHVAIFSGPYQNFRAYARKKKLLLLDTFNLTQYRIGELNNNLYGFSLLGSLTMSVIYKLLYYCNLESEVDMPDDSEILQQKLIDHVIKQIQILPDYDKAKLEKVCLPYFIKKLENDTTDIEIKNRCKETVSSVLNEAEQESWHGARVKVDSIVQLTLFAPARTCKTNPPLIPESDLIDLIEPEPETSRSRL